eukprot:CAMPEP_0113818030 /NCGR_PEP_ID=MMETSP0328-20130328/36_1 /TAXON_ID=39455 /ORGANISM="Alexandrium minutum" /LENGTH=387 /DNA_ID=CAMNT_0000785965 /DNA_START=84 /DNA_END=1247 /DNA_ORIENTATION=+ /assembly_acc=CAM_ASM_000350
MKPYGPLLIVLSAFAEQEIPVYKGGPDGVSKIFWQDYVKLTQNLTMPALVKGFFDPAPFADICACSPDAPLFDSIKLPFKDAGNAYYDMKKAQYRSEDMHFDAISGGKFYREHACAGKNDYIFYDVNNGALLSATMQDFYRKKIDPALKIDETITDKTYEHWFNEIFIGASTKKYPLPGSNGSGSAPHRAPVLNYYYQICGKKWWHIARHGASFGELDKHQFMLEDKDMLAFMKDDQVYQGFTEPGDVLLNPPWLWHLVQTDSGFNFAVTYKQLGYGWWAAINKMDPLQVAVNMQHGASDLSDQRLPYRPVTTLSLVSPNAFILDLWDIRPPLWLLRRFKRELAMAGLAVGLPLLACLGGCCWCCCRRRPAANGKANGKASGKVKKG